MKGTIILRQRPTQPVPIQAERHRATGAIVHGYEVEVVIRIRPTVSLLDGDRDATHLAQRYRVDQVVMANLICRAADASDTQEASGPVPRGGVEFELVGFERVVIVNYPLSLDPREKRFRRRGPATTAAAAAAAQSS